MRPSCFLVPTHSWNSGSHTCRYRDAFNGTIEGPALLSFTRQTVPAQDSTLQKQELMPQRASRACFRARIGLGKTSPKGSWKYESVEQAFASHSSFTNAHFITLCRYSRQYELLSCGLQHNVVRVLRRSNTKNQPSCIATCLRLLPSPSNSSGQSSLHYHVAVGCHQLYGHRVVFRMARIGESGGAYNKCCFRSTPEWGPENDGLEAPRGCDQRSRMKWFRNNRTVVMLRCSR